MVEHHWLVLHVCLHFTCSSTNKQGNKLYIVELCVVISLAPVQVVNRGLVAVGNCN